MPFTRSRTFDNPVQVFGSGDFTFDRRVETAINSGFNLRGEPRLMIGDDDDGNTHIYGSQSVHMRVHTSESYPGFIRVKDMVLPLLTGRASHLYRFVFALSEDICTIVEWAENQGWNAHGNHVALGFEGRRYIGQAVTKQIQGGYTGFDPEALKKTLAIARPVLPGNFTP